MLYFITFLFSAFLSLAFIQMFQYLYKKYNILDNPQKYNKKRDPIPYSMGVVFFIVFFLSSYLFIDFNYKLLLIWYFGLFITVISFIDDMVGLSPKIRLWIQIIIGATIGLTSIKIGYISNIFGGVINLETFFFTLGGIEIYLIPLLFTIFWYVFIFNALNWSDGIEGITSGISLVSFLILFFLGYILFLRDDYSGGIENAKFIMGMSIILVGILLPFWLYDVREKFLMGDSGTMFLGFMLATLAIIAGGKIATVLVVFGIYSVDALYVVLKRIRTKKNPMKGDFTHIHHRLQAIGLSKWRILGIIYGLSFFFGISALFLGTFGKVVIFLLLALLVIFLSDICKYVKK